MDATDRLKAVRMYCCLSLLLLISLLSVAQTTIDVEFTYDAAGNRTSRGVIVLGATPNSAIADTLSAKSSKRGDTVQAVEFYKDWMQTIEMQIYPNPTHGKVNIEMKGVGNEQTSRLEVFDSFGRKLYGVDARGAMISIDLSGYPRGSYIVVLSVGDDHRTWRVVKQ